MNAAITALVIPADSTRPVSCVDVQEDDTSWGDHIGCDWVTVIRTRYEDAQMIIDDHGILAGRPFNFRATCITRGTPIMGDALVLGLVGPATADVPQQVVDDVEEMSTEAPSPPAPPAQCGQCGRERGDDVEDYHPLQVIFGHDLGWYSGDDGEMCPACMESLLRTQR